MKPIMAWEGYDIYTQSDIKDAIKNSISLSGVLSAFPGVLQSLESQQFFAVNLSEEGPDKEWMRQLEGRLAVLEKHIEYQSQVRL
jgi:hypothetical protein